MYDATKLKEAKVLGDAVNDFFFSRETVLSSTTPRFKREPESEVDLFSRLRALIQTHKSYRATSPLRYWITSRLFRFVVVVVVLFCFDFVCLFVSFFLSLLVFFFFFFHHWATFSSLFVVQVLMSKSDRAMELSVSWKDLIRTNASLCLSRQAWFLFFQYLRCELLFESSNFWRQWSSLR